MEIDKLKEKGLAPSWMTDTGLVILKGGYLLDGETPKDMYDRVSTHAAKKLNMPELKDKFFELMWENILCVASPIAANLGANRALPISCYGITVPDSMEGIGNNNTELMMLTKQGGGVGINYGKIRGRGSLIKNGIVGKSDGSIPFMKINDSSILASKQAGTRKGACSFNLPVTHADFLEFLKIRRPQGDINRQCLNSHHCVQIPGGWMQDMLRGNLEYQHIWLEILRSRMETGEPYIQWLDNCNRNLSQAYKNNGLSVTYTNICSEISLPSDEQHSFVCCLSSLNIFRWHKIKPEHIKLCVYFLDAVMQAFIEESDGIPYLDRARRFSIKGRALGLGVLGWHSLLQRRMLPFDTSMDTMNLNAEVFRTIQKYAIEASKELAQRFGEPEWCKGTGVRNLNLTAVAPTVSNSRIAGGFSPGVEPIVANKYIEDGAKGTVLFENICLREFLEAKNKNTDDVWKSITDMRGSVQHLDFLSEHEKNVFKTAREINQFNIITQAGQRQAFIDQAQSINLFFDASPDPGYFHKIHIRAWELGVKTLYYVRSGSVLRGDSPSVQVSVPQEEECLSCDG